MKLNLRNWTYDDQKLANPLLILWKLLWFIPFKLSAMLTCGIAWITFGRYAAMSIWDETK